MNWLAGLLPTVWCAGMVNTILATDPSRCSVGVHQQRSGLCLVADGHVGKLNNTGWVASVTCGCCWKDDVLKQGPIKWGVFQKAFHQSQGIKIRWSRATFLVKCHPFFFKRKDQLGCANRDEQMRTNQSNLMQMLLVNLRDFPDS